MGVWLLLTRTSFGLLLRAGTQNPEMVSVLGTNIRTVYTLGFALGSALAGVAGVLVAPLVVQTLLQAIRDIRADGTTVLLVEQNVRAALQVAEQHYVMDKGHLVGCFSSEELQANEDLRTRFLGVSARL